MLLLFYGVVKLDLVCFNMLYGNFSVTCSVQNGPFLIFKWQTMLRFVHLSKKLLKVIYWFINLLFLFLSLVISYNATAIRADKSVSLTYWLVIAIVNISSVWTWDYVPFDVSLTIIQTKEQTMLFLNYYHFVDCTFSRNRCDV